MRHVVTSRDGIQFVVDSATRSVPADRLFASRWTAEALERHGDFHRVTDIDLAALLAPDPPPVRQRPQLRLIRGGKS
jgi:hypothetical protein